MNRNLYLFTLPFLVLPLIKKHLPTSNVEIFFNSASFTFTVFKRKFILVIFYKMLKHGSRFEAYFSPKLPCKTQAIP